MDYKIITRPLTLNEYTIYNMSSYEKYLLKLFKRFLLDYNAYSFIHNLYATYRINILYIKGPNGFISEIFHRINHRNYTKKELVFLSEIFDMWLMEIAYNKKVQPYHRITAAKTYNKIHRNEIESKRTDWGAVICDYKRIDEQELKELIRNGK